MSRHLVSLLLLGCIVACGGGGGGLAPFGLSGSFPADGASDVSVDTTLVVTFTRPADLGSVTAETVALERRDGAAVAFDFDNRALNASTIRVVPRFGLEPNEIYSLVVRGSVRAEDGTELGEDIVVCFVTANPVPTVRPDQIVDLGDRLNVPRYLARAVRLLDGRRVVFGGYSGQDTVTDTIEVWDPATRTFELLPVRMNVPRAEHTVTLLADGRVVIAGGVSEPGGEPLASTGIFDPSNNGLGPGPPLLQARRWHAASPFEGAATVMVTGGFATAEDDSAVATGEVLRGNVWEPVPGSLAGPVAQHVQAANGLGQVYVGVGNFLAQAGSYRDGAFSPRTEGDARFRSAYLPVADDRIVVVGGDTRSCVVYDFGEDRTWLGTSLTRQRRGAHSLTVRDGDPHLFLLAGGFQISAPGMPPLRTLELVRYTPLGQLDTPDVTVLGLASVELPVPFAGHVGFTEAGGATVLAGGVGDGTGPHSRRVVMILDANSTPPLECD